MQFTAQSELPLVDMVRLGTTASGVRVFAESVTASLSPGIDLASRGACGLLSHYGENSLGSPTIALHHTFQLGPPVRRHAEAIDDDVADLVRAVVRTQAPIDSDRLKHRAVSSPRAGFTSELAGDNYPIRLRPADDRPQTTAAIGVLQQSFTIGDHDEILEQPEEFLLL